MLWLALALVVGQILGMLVVIRLVRSFGQYASAIEKHTDALLVSHRYEVDIHENNRRMMLDLLKIRESLKESA